MAPRETIVSPKTPMPKGYAFLKKGIKYKTLHCRRLTHEAGLRVYVVSERKKTLGIRVPKHIYHQVQSLANETFGARQLATEKRDEALERTAAAEIDRQFPNIPEEEKSTVLKHGFRKYSGRVGRTGQMPMEKKALFAVIAHVRHKHTPYDKLLENGCTRNEARRTIQDKLQDTLILWGGSPRDFGWYFESKRDTSNDETSDD